MSDVTHRTARFLFPQYYQFPSLGLGRASGVGRNSPTGTECVFAKYGDNQTSNAVERHIMRCRPMQLPLTFFFTVSRMLTFIDRRPKRWKPFLRISMRTALATPSDHRLNKTLASAFASVVELVIVSHVWLTWGNACS